MRIAITCFCICICTAIAFAFETRENLLPPVPLDIASPVPASLTEESISLVLYQIILCETTNSAVDTWSEFVAENQDEYSFQDVKSWIAKSEANKKINVLSRPEVMVMDKESGLVCIGNANSEIWVNLRPVITSNGIKSSVNIKQFKPSSKITAPIMSANLFSCDAGPVVISADSANKNMIVIIQANKLK